MVAAGIILAVLPFAPRVNLTKDLIFTALLPPLLFEAAYYISLGPAASRFHGDSRLGNRWRLRSGPVSPRSECTTWRAGNGSAHWCSAFSSPPPTRFRWSPLLRRPRPRPSKEQRASVYNASLQGIAVENLTPETAQGVEDSSLDQRRGGGSSEPHPATPLKLVYCQAT